MEIYEKIKNRRKELGLSAEDVADSLGVSRATVYRYESADIEKLPITSLLPLSKVLKCTPGYLMGWEDDDNNPVTSGFTLDSNEQKLLNSYRSFNATGKAKLMDYVADLDSSPRNKEGFQDSSTGEIGKSDKDSLGRFA